MYNLTTAFLCILQVKLGHSLDAATAFTTLALFNLLSFPFAFLPLGFAQYSQSRVSTDRMLKFLDAEELDPYVSTEVAADGSVLSMEHVSMAWVKEDTVAALPAPSSGFKDIEALEKPEKSAKDSNRSVRTLRDICLNIKKGSFVAVIGPVGSGKSSLLNGFLGELILTSGTVRAAGSIGASMSNFNL